MKKLSTLGSLALSLTLTTTAFANPDAKKPAEAKPADKAAAGAPAMKAEAPAPPEMKPAAELEQLKGMAGTWKCKGEVTAMGNKMPSEMTMKSGLDMDGYWMMSMGTEKKAKGSKMPAYKSHDMTGYDATTKQFVRMGVDNMGSWTNATSKGWNGDAMEWIGTGKMMGQDTKINETVTKDATGKNVTIKGTTTAGGQPIVTWDMACKK